MSGPLLSTLHHTDLTKNPDGAREFLLEALHRVEASWLQDRSPLPGLAPLDVDQHLVFFGRGEETRELAKLLGSPAEQVQGAAVPVVDPSGYGKIQTSLMPMLLLMLSAALLPPHFAVSLATETDGEDRERARPAVLIAAKDLWAVLGALGSRSPTSSIISGVRLVGASREAG